MKKQSLFASVSMLPILLLALLFVSCGSETSKKENLAFNVNGVEFTMVYVEGGTFMMGSEDSEAGENEKPVHQVTLSDYYIGQTEVTQALWQSVMGSNPSGVKGDSLPVDQVSWYDCQDFIVKLNEASGENFSMPTEAQWEFAARGGIHSKGYKYSGSDELESVGWNDFNLTRGSTHPVGTKQANELGIYDMCGNVSEWCSDWYGEYTSDAVTDPTGPSSGSEHMHRGGSWDESETDSRSTSRNVYDEEPYYVNGLRLALKK